MAGTSPPHQYYRELVHRSGSAELFHKILSVNSVCRDNGVTPIYTLAHLAQVAGVPYRLLDSLVLRVDNNYKDFSIKKKSPPGVRKISAPSDLLSHMQRVLLDRCLPSGLVSRHSYAYMRGLGTKDVAKLHLGARSMVSLDITDFFGSCKSDRVFKIYREAGYPKLLSFQMSALSTRGMSLETYAPLVADRPSGKLYRAALGYLPQGAPTSGMISNILLANFDVYISAIVSSFGGVYSRYADDLQFSFSEIVSSDSVKKLIREVRSSLSEMNLYLNNSKTHVQRSSSDLHVLGYTLHDNRISLNRRYKDKVRALIYAINKYGPDDVALRFGKIDRNAVMESLEGHYVYVRYADPRFYDEVELGIHKLMKKHGNFSPNYTGSSF